MARRDRNLLFPDGPSIRRASLWIDGTRGVTPGGGRGFTAASFQCFDAAHATEWDLAAGQDAFVSAWVWAPSFVDNATVWATGGVSAANTGIILRLYSTGGRIEAMLSDGTLYQKVGDADKVLTASTWHHLLVTIDRDGMLWMYLDGVKAHAAGLDISAANGSAVTSVYNTLRIGSQLTNANGWEGRLSRVYFAKGSLPTAAEIAELATGVLYQDMTSALKAKITHGYDLTHTGDEPDVVGSVTGTATNGPIPVVAFSTSHVARDTDAVYSHTSRDSGQSVFTHSGTAPIYQASELRGRPTQTYDGSGTVLKLGSAKLTGSAGHVFAVVQTDEIDEAQVVYAQSDEATDTHYLLLGITSDNFIWYKWCDGGTADELKGDTELSTGWHVLEWASDGSTITMRVDGALEGITVVGGGNNGNWFEDVAGDDNSTIGGLIYNSGTASVVTGDISQVVAHDTAITTRKANEERSWLMGKHGIAVPTFLIAGVLFGLKDDIALSSLIVSPARAVGTFTWTAAATDATRSRILCVDDDLEGSATELSYTANGVDLTKIADLDDAGFSSAGFVADLIKSVAVLSDGTYLMCVQGASGIQNETDVVPVSRIYRSTDGGTTWAAATFTHPSGVLVNGADIYAAKDGTGLPYGYIPRFGWGGISESPHLVIIEYGQKQDDDVEPPPYTERSALGVYVSSNGGLTWQWAYRHDEGDGVHGHAACFEPGSSQQAIWFSHGDDTEGLHRIAKSGASWTETYDDTRFQPVQVTSYNDKIYLGSDQGSMPNISRWDYSAKRLVDVLECPRYAGTSPNYFYATTSGTGYGWTIRQMGTLYYGQLDNFVDGSGLWVSDDLEEWVPVFRTNAEAGVDQPVESSTALWCSARKYNLPVAQTRSCYVSMPAITNLYSVSQHDDFSYASIADLTATYGWNSDDMGHMTAELVSGEGLFGGTALRITRKFGDMTANLRLPPLDTYITETLADNDQITVVAWVKAGDDWSGTILLDNAFTDATYDVFRPSTANSLVRDGSYIPLTFHYDVKTAATLPRAELAPRFEFADGEDADHDFLVGGLAVYHSQGAAARNWQGFPPFIKDFIPAKQPAVTITTSVAAFTIIFAWRPEAGQYHYRQINRKLPICTLSAAAGALELYWTNEDNKIYLESAQHGGAGGRTGAAVAYPMFTRDVVWVVLRGVSGTGAGCYTLVTIYDPVNGQTLEHGYDLGDDGTESLFYLNGLPTTLTLGANTVAGLVGYGRFACVSHSEEVLSDAAVEALIDTLVTA